MCLFRIVDVRAAMVVRTWQHAQQSRVSARTVVRIPEAYVLPFHVVEFTLLCDKNVQ